MKKPTKRDTINLFFSAFLIIAFIVCAHFFSQYASALSQPLGSIIPILVYAVFGLLMFYATRVGDGKAVKQPRENTRHKLVNNYLVKCLPLVTAKVKGGIVNALIHSFDSWYNIKHNKRNTKAYVRN